MASFDHYSIVNPDELVQRMHRIRTNDALDIEEMHERMDEVLCEALEKLGYGTAVGIFEHTPKYYS